MLNMNIATFYQVIYMLILISFDSHDDHGNLPPGDLHVDPDHGGLLPLLDADPHLQHLGCFRAPWIWQLRQIIQNV